MMLMLNLIVFNLTKLNWFEYKSGKLVETGELLANELLGT